MGPFKDIVVELADDMVATIEIRRPPHNFFDIELIRQIADACEGLDKDSACRAIVLAAQGTAFCAGAKLGDGADVQNVLVKKSETGQAGHLYIEAVRLFRTAKPMVGAIHGAAVGGGLGLALVPDLRVTCPEARFAAGSDFASMMAVQAFKAWSLCWPWHSFQISVPTAGACARAGLAVLNASNAAMNRLRICIGWPSFMAWLPK